MWWQHLRCVSLHHDLYLSKRPCATFCQRNASGDFILHESTVLNMGGATTHRLCWAFTIIAAT